MCFLAQSPGERSGNREKSSPSWYELRKREQPQRDPGRARPCGHLRFRPPFPHGVWALKALTTHLGLIRLATTTMSLTLAEFFILAPEPIVMATSFSVKV